MKTLIVLGLAVAIGNAAAAFAACPLTITLKGSNADNTLLGGPGGDRIVGYGGNDTLRGFGGDDCLNGGSYDDTIEGGDGDDRIAGEGGNDTLSGGPGNDNINGGSNDDVIDGGDGDDVLAGGGGADVINGGRGVDKTNGGTGPDTIILTAGDVPAGKIEKIDGAGDVDTLQANFLITLQPPPLATIVTDPLTGGTYRIKNVETFALVPTTTTSTSTSTTTTTTLLQCNGGTPDAADVCSGQCPAGSECATRYDTTTGAGCVCVPAPACRAAVDGNCPAGDRCVTSAVGANRVCGELLCCASSAGCTSDAFNGGPLSCSGSAFAGAVCNASNQCCDDGGGPCH